LAARLAGEALSGNGYAAETIMQRLPVKIAPKGHVTRCSFVFVSYL
jgi:hypothetical protein